MSGLQRTAAATGDPDYDLALRLIGGSQPDPSRLRSAGQYQPTGDDDYDRAMAIISRPVPKPKSFSDDTGVIGSGALATSEISRELDRRRLRSFATSHGVPLMATPDDNLQRAVRRATTKRRAPDETTLAAMSRLTAGAELRRQIDANNAARGVYAKTLADWKLKAAGVNPDPQLQNRLADQMAGSHSPPPTLALPYPDADEASKRLSMIQAANVKKQVTPADSIAVMLSGAPYQLGDFLADVHRQTLGQPAQGVQTSDGSLMSRDQVAKDIASRLGAPAAWHELLNPDSPIVKSLGKSYAYQQPKAMTAAGEVEVAKRGGIDFAGGGYGGATANIAEGIMREAGTGLATDSDAKLYLRALAAVQSPATLTAFGAGDYRRQDELGAGESLYRGVVDLAFGIAQGMGAGRVTGALAQRAAARLVAIESAPALAAAARPALGDVFRGALARGVLAGTRSGLEAGGTLGAVARSAALDQALNIGQLAPQAAVSADDLQKAGMPRDQAIGIAIGDTLSGFVGSLNPFQGSEGQQAAAVVQLAGLALGAYHVHKSYGEFKRRLLVDTNLPMLKGLRLPDSLVRDLHKWAKAVETEGTQADREARIQRVQDRLSGNLSKEEYLAAQVADSSATGLNLADNLGTFVEPVTGDAFRREGQHDVQTGELAARRDIADPHFTHELTHALEKEAGVGPEIYQSQFTDADRQRVGEWIRARGDAYSSADGEHVRYILELLQTNPKAFKRAPEPVRRLVGMIDERSVDLRRSNRLGYEEAAKLGLADPRDVLSPEARKEGRKAQGIEFATVRPGREVITEQGRGLVTKVLDSDEQGEPRYLVKVGDQELEMGGDDFELPQPTVRNSATPEGLPREHDIRPGARVRLADGREGFAVHLEQEDGTYYQKVKIAGRTERVLATDVHEAEPPRTWPKPDEIAKFASDQAVPGAAGKEKLKVGEVGGEISRQMEELGIRRSHGYEITLESDRIRHVMQSHGGETEGSRGQLPILPSDFAQLESVINSPDKIESGDLLRGKPTAIFTKRINGHLLAVVTTSNARNELRLVTMWKRAATGREPMKESGGGGVRHDMSDQLGQAYGKTSENEAPSLSPPPNDTQGNLQASGTPLDPEEYGLIRATKPRKGNPDAKGLGTQQRQADIIARMAERGITPSGKTSRSWENTRQAAVLLREREDIRQRLGEKSAGQGISDVELAAACSELNDLAAALDKYDAQLKQDPNDRLAAANRDAAMAQYSELSLRTLDLTSNNGRNLAAARMFTDSAGGDPHRALQQAKRIAKRELKLEEAKAVTEAARKLQAEEAKRKALLEAQEAELRAKIELDPHDKDLHAKLAELYIKLGKSRDEFSDTLGAATGRDMLTSEIDDAWNAGGKQYVESPVTPEDKAIGAAKDNLAQEIAKTAENTALEFFSGMWRSNLLLSARPFQASLFGNAYGIITESLSSMPMAFVDALISKATGERTVSMAGVEKLIPSALSRDAARSAIQALRTGSAATEDANHLQRRTNFRLGGHGSRTPVMDALGKVLDPLIALENWKQNKTYDVLSMADAPARRAFFERHLIEQADLQARREGLKTRAERNKRVVGILGPSTKPELFLRAIAAAADSELLEIQRTILKSAKEREDEAVLANSTPISNFLGHVSNDPIGAFILPFSKIPTNAIARGLEHLPLGALYGLARAAEAIITKDPTRSYHAQYKAATAIARSITGSGLMYLGYLLFRAGMLSTSSSFSPSERDAQDAAGIQGGSVKIGNRWYRVTDSPASMALLLGAEIARHQDLSGELSPKSISESAGKTAFNQMRQIPALQSVQNISDTLTELGREDFAGDQMASLADSKMVRGYGGSVLPAIVGDVAAFVDNFRRAGKTFEAGFKQDTPGRYAMSPEYDALGRPLLRTAGVESQVRGLSPDMSERLSDRGVQEAYRLGISLSRPPKIRAKGRVDRDLSENDYQDRVRSNGLAVRTAIDELVTSDWYKTASDKDRRDEMQKEVQRAKARESARIRAERVAERSQ